MSKHCQCCGGTAKLVKISAKCSDMFMSSNIKTGKYYEGYCPDWIGAGGDYLDMTICRHCGTVQGDWPHYRDHDKFKWGKAN